MHIKPLLLLLPFVTTTLAFDPAHVRFCFNGSEAATDCITHCTCSIMSASVSF